MDCAAPAGRASGHAGRVGEQQHDPARAAPVIRHARHDDGCRARHPEEEGHGDDGRRRCLLRRRAVQRRRRGQNEIQIGGHRDGQLRPDVAVRSRVRQPHVAHHRPAGRPHSRLRPRGRGAGAGTGGRPPGQGAGRPGAGFVAGHAVRHIRHAQPPSRVPELLRDHAGPRRLRPEQRDDPRHADLPHRRRTAPVEDVQAVPRRLAGPLGGRHAGGGHDQLRAERLPPHEHGAAACHREIPARCRGHRRVLHHDRRSRDVVAPVDVDDPAQEDRRTGVRVRLP